MMITVEKCDKVTICADRLRKIDGSEEIRLFKETGDLKAFMFRFPLSEIEKKIDHVRDFGDVNDINVYNIVKFIHEKYSLLPVVQETKNIGFQYDTNNQITGFLCSELIMVDGSTKEVDRQQDLPLKSGKMGIEILNDYMRNHVERQVIILHMLSAPVTALFAQNYILGICSKSSHGKTSIAKVAQSIVGNADYDKLNLSFNQTLNAVEMGLAQNFGLGVLIDDTSLAPKSFRWEEFIYRLADGRIKKRVTTQKGKFKLSEDDKFHTSVLLTCEDSLFLSVNPEREGNNGRYIEIPAKGNQLFDGDEQCHQMMDFCSKNYGNIMPKFIRSLFRLGIEETKSRVQTEKQKIIERNEIDSHIMKRLLLYLSILNVSADIATTIGLNFDKELITQFLIETINLSLAETREIQSDNIVLEIGNKLMEKAKETARITEDGGYIINSEERDIIVNSILSSLPEKQRPINKVVNATLWEMGILDKVRGAYSVSFTYQKESIRGYLIRVSKELKEDCA